MSGFKLLAIRPLKDCNPKFLKVLNEGEIYQFYNDYTFIKESKDIHSNVKEIKYKSSIPEDLYNIDGVNLNISAIVGENGSGKSSLMELLFVSVYLLSVNQKILKLNNSYSFDEKKDEIDTRIKELEEKLTTLLKEDKITKLESFFDEGIAKKLNTIKWQKEQRRRVESLQGELDVISKSVRVEIFYQISKTVFRLKIDSKQEKNHCQFATIKSNFGSQETDEIKKIIRESKIDGLIESPFNLSEMFFYNLVLNYSQYALNSNEIGDWITELFHKNDGYQTPIVINPMRTKGNFDINRENDLVKQRLLVNILTLLKKGEKIEDSLRHLAQNHIAHRIKITLNEDKFKNDKNKEELKNCIKYPEAWKIIEKEFFDENVINDKNWNRYAKDYIIGKLISMAEKYPPYYKYYDDNDFINLTTEGTNTGYLDALKNDSSHIAYKFHQAINFLKYDYSKLYFDSQESGSINKIAKELSNIENIELMHKIPPSFLTVDVLFDKKHPKLKEGEEESNTLMNLSSGEKQYVYSISSIMYHLRYLDSVNVVNKKNKEEEEIGKDELKYKYKYINLVFDEIELYYHPEFQRQFINDFRNAVGRCNLEDIKNINCTFITHSPFILSDISSTNILRLEEGKSKPVGNQTFAANIHELLGSSFFLKNGFVGEFAKSKIEELIKYYNNYEKLGSKQENNSFDEEKALEFISIIDDRLIRNRLQEIHDSHFKNSEEKLLDGEKDYAVWLNDELERIKPIEE